MISSTAKAIPATGAFILQRLFTSLYTIWLNYFNIAVLWASPSEKLSLPPELLDLVFSFADVNSLMTCSKALESTDLCALVHKWLYRDVLVYRSQGNRQVTGNDEKRLYISDSHFLKLLKSKRNGRSKPNTHVRALCILLAGSGIERQTPWSILFQPALLPCLRTLVLSSDTGSFQRQGEKWGECDLAFRKAFLNRLAWMGKDGTGGIEEASFSVEGFPAKDLERCVRLRKLTLTTKLDFSAPPLLSKLNTGPKDLQLQDLTINHLSQLDGFKKWLIPSRTGCMISDLRSLDFSCINADHLESFRNILESCKNRLQELTVNFGPDLFCSCNDVSGPGLASLAEPWNQALKPTLASVLRLRALCALQKLTICSRIQSREVMFVSNLPNEKPLERKHYRSSIREIGAFLQEEWTPTSAKSRCKLELKIAFFQDDPDGASLAEMDFEPFLRSVPVDFQARQDGSVFEPAFIMKIIGYRKLHPYQPLETIPVVNLAADVRKNEVLRQMNMEGKIRVLAIPGVVGGLTLSE